MANLLEKMGVLAAEELENQDKKSPGERLSIKVAELMEENQKLVKQSEKLKDALREAVEEWEFNLANKSDILIKSHKDRERIQKIRRMIK
jgi:hypothetical protein